MAGFRKHYVLHGSQVRHLWDTLNCEARMSQGWEYITYGMGWVSAHQTVDSAKQDPLQKPTGPQLVKTFMAFYGTQRYITEFRTACQLFLSSALSH